MRAILSESTSSRVDFPKNLGERGLGGLRQIYVTVCTIGSINIRGMYEYMYIMHVFTITIDFIT